MKQILLFLISFVLISFLFVSCEKDEKTFDESLLIGKWVSGTLYYRYDSDGTGVSWDKSEDISEEEAQPFEWELVNSELTHYHLMEMKGSDFNVVKIYTVTQLTANTLRYEDNFTSKSFTKVN